MHENEELAEKVALLEDISQIQSTKPVLIPDEELNSKMRSLNDTQRNFFDLVHGWAKKKTEKNLSSSTPTGIDRLHIFLTGNAVCRKRFLTKALYQSLSKSSLTKIQN